MQKVQRNPPSNSRRYLVKRNDRCRIVPTKRLPSLTSKTENGNRLVRLNARSSRPSGLERQRREVGRSRTPSCEIRCRQRICIAKAVCPLCQKSARRLPTTNQSGNPWEGEGIPTIRPPSPAAGDRRVAVEEKHVQPMRIGIVLVHRRQLAKRREVRLPQPGPLQCVAVALPLAATADRVAQRLQQREKDGENAHQPGEGVDGQLRVVDRPADPGPDPTKTPKRRSQRKNPAALAKTPPTIILRMWPKT